MSLLFRPKSIIGTKDRRQHFTESGTFCQIHYKLSKRSIEVLDGLVRKFVKYIRTFEYFPFISVLLSFLCFGKLRAHILHAEQ